MLKILAEQTAPVELESLALAVAAQENDRDRVTEEIVKQIACSLHHIHLPKMTDYGVVDYDASAACVESYQ